MKKGVRRKVCQVDVWDPLYFEVHEFPCINNYNRDLVSSAICEVKGLYRCLLRRFNSRSP